MVLTPERIQQIKEELASLPPEQQQAKIQEILSTLSPEEIQQLQGGQTQCPFCLMTSGEIQVKKIYEDSVVLAILDINPANKGHTLIFPKKHYNLITQLSDKEAGHLFKAANKVAAAILEALNAQGCNLYVAAGPAAGQTAPHVLMNIIPRFENDGIKFGWPPKKLSDEEMSEIATKVIEKTKNIEIKEEVEVVKKEEVKAEEEKEEHRIP